jgi:uncharacterized membrane protein
MYYGYFDPITIIFHILEWILIVWFIVWIIRGARRNRRHHFWCDGQNCNHPMHSGGAMDVLKERYVKGEINKEEYEEKKRVLTGN